MATPNTLEKAIWLKLMGLGIIPGAGLGNVFYVDGVNGNDAWDGLTPNTPFATITHALTQCVADNDDYIIVLDHWQEVVAINVTRVHIIGIPANPNHSFVQMNAAADTAIFTVTALSNNCEIAGFSFGGGATHAAIENVAGTPMGLYIHHCQFGYAFAQNTPQDGIRIGINATNIRVEHCKFLGPDSPEGTITRDGIHWVSGGDPMGGAFHKNVFHGLSGGIGINLAAVAALTGGFIIDENLFYVAIADAMAAGWAITLAGPGNVAHCLISGNYASQTGDNTGTNPFRDLSTGVLATCLNGWVGNYVGQLISAGPAVV